MLFSYSYVYHIYAGHAARATRAQSKHHPSRSSRCPLTNLMVGPGYTLPEPDPWTHTPCMQPHVEPGAGPEPYVRKAAEGCRAAQTAESRTEQYKAQGKVERCRAAWSRTEPPQSPGRIVQSRAEIRARATVLQSLWSGTWSALTFYHCGDGKLLLAAKLKNSHR